MTRLQRGATPHLILSAAGQEGLTQHQLAGRLAERGHLPEEAAIHAAVYSATKCGYLAIVGIVRGTSAPANLYALTAEGEAVLDVMGRAW